MIKIGSLFSGIGGFELGLERAIPNSKTIWQVEQNKFCQKVLRKHWPDAKIYNDVKNITAQNVEPIDLLCGGFPCQDISIAGKQRGIHEGEKSSLWWQMLRIISELEPRIVVLENVHAIISNGGLDVLGSLASIGYDAEWTVISARQFGAPHLRKRWFCVAYPNRKRSIQTIHRGITQIISTREEIQRWGSQGSKNASYPDHYNFSERTKMGIKLEKARGNKQISPWNQNLSSRENNKKRGYWKEISSFSPVCGLDDGVSKGLDQAKLKLKEKHRKESLKAFGNAIVPQCSEYIGECIVKSGLLEEI